MINHPNRKRASRAKMAAQSAVSQNHDHDYSALLEGVRASFAAATADSERLFATDADGLPDLYLDSLPAERQHHNCSACRRFIERYGNLVTISETGETTPAMWNPAGIPEFYQSTFSAMRARVKKARVVSAFLAKEDTWGTPMTGEWSHMAVMPTSAMLYHERALTAGQAMAVGKENLRTVATALTEFTVSMLDEAIRLLQADTLARSEKFIGPVKWLRALHDRPKGRLGENVLWRAVTTAPEGYCHPKASVIGPLLDDIAAGLPFAEIKARFDAKMHPLQYQRPQAAPSAGNIAASEALVAKLGIAPSLERRFARLDELQTIWRPTARPKPETAGGVFGHLKAKDANTVQSVDLPGTTMTWDKFTRTVMPNVEQVEISVPGHGRFIALTTAANADAPPIMKWDREDERNPFAWYVYHNGSPAQQWRLTGGAWAKIAAIVNNPTMWGSKPMSFLGEGVVLIIEGAVDTRTNSGNALFPECLREELHGARPTIEAYSRSAILGGREEASACGYHIGKGSADCVLRTFVAGSWTPYRIDRWD